MMERGSASGETIFWFVVCGFLLIGVVSNLPEWTESWWGAEGTTIVLRNGTTVTKLYVEDCSLPYADNQDYIERNKTREHPINTVLNWKIHDLGKHCSDSVGLAPDILPSVLAICRGDCR